MTIRIVEGGRYLLFWFIAGDASDFIGCVYQVPGEGVRLDYRFRYYNGDPDPAADDRKSWYSVVPPEDGIDADTKLCEVLDAICRKLMSEGFMPDDKQLDGAFRVDNIGDANDFTVKCMSLPCFHVVSRQLDDGAQCDVPPEEREAQKQRYIDESRQERRRKQRKENQR